MDSTKDKKIIFIRHYNSPVGEMIIGSFDNKLCLCDWASKKRMAVTLPRLTRALNARIAEDETFVIRRALNQLNQYFVGERTSFDLPVYIIGTTFQCRVWDTLNEIPYGETASYSDIAGKIGQPGAVRAIASAIASNSISIIVPCHRVIGKNGSLTGYAGGLEAKRKLLYLEKSVSSHI